MTPRVGDVVHVRGTVVQKNLGPQRWAVQFDGDDHKSGISEDAIVHIEPAPLKVGDRVIWDKFFKARIEARNARHAWVIWDDDEKEDSVVPLSQLERLP